MAENINTYQGNAALGQGTAGPNIGPIGVYEMKNVNDAVDKLMQYQVWQNRDQWARNNLLVDQQAAKAAQDMSFTIGDWLPKDRDTIMGKIKSMNDMYAKYPNRTRLLADGSNAKEVAEWQQIGNDIEADIKQANRRKTQDLSLVAQIDKTTDPVTRAKVAGWRDRYINTDIGEDILLYPDLESFVPPAAPTFTYETDPIYYDKDNKLVGYKFSAPDIGRGVASLQTIMDDPKNSAARDFIVGGAKRYNDLVQRFKTENPNDTAEQLQAKLLANPQGKTMFDMLNKTAKDIQFNNQVASEQGRSGLKGAQPVAEVSTIDWFNSGIDENAYMKMLTSSRGVTAVDVTSGQPKLGFEAEQLAQGRGHLAIGWAGLKLQREQFELSKDKKVDPLIKNAAIAQLLLTPFQPGATPDQEGIVNIPLNQEVKNMFAKPINETDLTTVNQKAGTSTVQKFKELDIVSVQAKKVGSDPNDTQIIVTYKNPIDGTTTTDTYDRASLNLPANNVLGATNAYKVADADADFKKKLGTPNPVLQQMFPELGKLKRDATGATAQDPLPLPILSNGKRDNNKLIAGKWYILPDGSVQQYKGG